MDITIGIPQYMNRLHDGLIRMFPEYVQQIRVHGTANSIRVFTTESNGTEPVSIPEIDSLVSDIVSGHMTIVPDINKSFIAADGEDEAVIGIGGGNFEYSIYADGTRIAFGTVTDGSLEFSTDQPGTYAIEIISGNNTGYVEITAS